MHGVVSVGHGGRRHLLTRGSKFHENGFSRDRAIKTFWYCSHCHLFERIVSPAYLFSCMISVKDGSQFKPNSFFLFPFIRKCSLCLACDAVDQDKLAQRFESWSHEYSSKTVADWSTLSKNDGDWRSEDPQRS